MRFKLEGYITKEKAEEEIINKKFGVQGHRVIDVPAILSKPSIWYVIETHIKDGKFYSIVNTFEDNNCAIQYVDFCKRKGIIVC